MEMKVYYTIKEFAEKAEITQAEVLRMIDKKEIPHKSWDGGTIRIPITALHEFLKKGWEPEPRKKKSKLVVKKGRPPTQKINKMAILAQDIKTVQEMICTTDATEIKKLIKLSRVLLSDLMELDALDGED